VEYRTAFVAHPDCGRHDTGWAHPEHQGRLPAIVDALTRDTPALLEYVLQHEPAPAREEDLLRVHTADHVERVRGAVEESARLGRPVRLDSDTPVSGASWDAALAAAGCAIAATELVLSGKSRTAFAAARPPGHHATPDRAMGFCLFNNVAVAARHAQLVAGLQRVMIIDWDVHHGNGTQDIFYHDGSVYFVSLHQSPHYPGTGAERERGAGAGLGTTRNVALAAGTPRPAYRRAFEDALDSSWSEFSPQLVLISAGMDCLAGDPLGGLLLEPRDLHAMTRSIMERAEGSGAAVVAVLEGGYAPPRVGLAVVDVLRAFADLPPKAD
jgi:acetoin utilization deacetylase AcuC-like enzyme